MKKIITITYALLFTLCISAQILVIPDVHGRSFWKEAVDKHPTLPIIFLGDYLDPYAREHITPDEALANFKDIIAFKQANNERVTLLIGNHEIHYLDPFYKFSRKDEAFIDDALMEIAKRRGGESEAGSCLWADLEEHKKSKSFNGIYQVFGHTQQKKKAVIKKSFADLDCRKAFLITASGKIIEAKK